MADQLLYAVEFIDNSDMYAQDATVVEYLFAEKELADAQAQVLHDLLAQTPDSSDYLVSTYTVTVANAVSPASFCHRGVASRALVAKGFTPGVISTPVFGDDARSLESVTRMPTADADFVDICGYDLAAVQIALASTVAVWQSQDTASASS
jgi:hypothetical protein